ncbi:MAG: BrnA antitoxin family protein [Candidatus Doudnabacteria bacterium]|nr:BrnA antitoxin family protein [Candidatus Doudnabacteria bacterium]
MKKKLKKIPKFKNEDEDREFWDTHSSVDYIDWSKAQHIVFPNLKPTSRSISIRLPEYIISMVKVEANKLDIPYQALMKQYIAKGVLKK